MTELQCEQCGSKRVEIINRDGNRRAQCLECAAEFSVQNTAKCPRCGADSPIDGFWASCPEYGCGNFFYTGSPTPQVIDSPGGFERDDDRQTTVEPYVDPDEKRLRFLESELKRHADTILSTMDRIDSLSDTVSRLLARIERLETDLGSVTERLGYLDGGEIKPRDLVGRSVSGMTAQEYGVWREHRKEISEMDKRHLENELNELSDGGAFPPEDFEDFMNNLSINKAGKPK